MTKSCEAAWLSPVARSDGCMWDPQHKRSGCGADRSWKPVRGLPNRKEEFIKNEEDCAKNAIKIF